MNSIGWLAPRAEEAMQTQASIGRIVAQGHERVRRMTFLLYGIQSDNDFTPKTLGGIGKPYLPFRRPRAPFAALPGTVAALNIRLGPPTIAPSYVGGNSVFPWPTMPPPATACSPTWPRCAAM